MEPRRTKSVVGVANSRLRLLKMQDADLASKIVLMSEMDPKWLPKIVFQTLFCGSFFGGGAGPIQAIASSVPLPVPHPGGASRSAFIDVLLESYEGLSFSDLVAGVPPQRIKDSR